MGPWCGRVFGASGWVLGRAGRLPAGLFRQGREVFRGAPALWAGLSTGKRCRRFAPAQGRVLSARTGTRRPGAGARAGERAGRWTRELPPSLGAMRPHLTKRLSSPPVLPRLRKRGKCARPYQSAHSSPYRKTHHPQRWKYQNLARNNRHLRHQNQPIS